MWRSTSASWTTKHGCWQESQSISAGQRIMEDKARVLARVAEPQWREQANPSVMPLLLHAGQLGLGHMRAPRQVHIGTRSALSVSVRVRVCAAMAFLALEGHFWPPLSGAKMAAVGRAESPMGPVCLGSQPLCPARRPSATPPRGAFLGRGGQLLGSQPLSSRSCSHTANARARLTQGCTSCAQPAGLGRGGCAKSWLRGRTEEHNPQKRMGNTRLRAGFIRHVPTPTPVLTSARARAVVACLGGISRSFFAGMSRSLAGAGAVECSVLPYAPCAMRTPCPFQRSARRRRNSARSSSSRERRSARCALCSSTTPWTLRGQAG